MQTHSHQDLAPEISLSRQQRHQQQEEVVEAWQVSSVGGQAGEKAVDYLVAVPLLVSYQQLQSRSMCFVETRHIKVKINSSNRRRNLGNRVRNSRAIFKPGLFRLARRRRSIRLRQQPKPPSEANMHPWG